MILYTAPLLLVHSMTLYTFHKKCWWTKINIISRMADYRIEVLAKYCSIGYQPERAFDLAVTKDKPNVHPSFFHSCYNVVTHSPKQRKKTGCMFPLFSCFLECTQRKTTLVHVNDWSSPSLFHPSGLGSPAMYAFRPALCLVVSWWVRCVCLLWITQSSWPPVCTCRKSEREWIRYLPAAMCTT